MRIYLWSALRIMVLRMGDLRKRGGVDESACGGQTKDDNNKLIGRGAFTAIC